jgi:hypothetical protein
LALAVVRDLRGDRAPATAEELADFETDVLAGFVLARASAGLTDSTVFFQPAAASALTTHMCSAGKRQPNADHMPLQGRGSATEDGCCASHHGVGSDQDGPLAGSLSQMVWRSGVAVSPNCDHAGLPWRVHCSQAACTPSQSD